MTPSGSAYQPTEESAVAYVPYTSKMGYFAAWIRELRIVRTGLADDGGIIDNPSPPGVLYITASTNSISVNPLGAPIPDV